MFCPQCGAEYEEGFTECADCHVALTTEAPPPPPAPEYVELVPLLATDNVVDIALIKGVLEGEGIAHHFEGEGFMRAYPMVRSARLLVKADQVEQARAALRTLDLKYFPFAPTDSDSS